MDTIERTEMTENEITLALDVVVEAPVVEPVEVEGVTEQDTDV